MQLFHQPDEQSIIKGTLRSFHCNQIWFCLHWCFSPNPFFVSSIYSELFWTVFVNLVTSCSSTSMKDKCKNSQKVDFVGQSEERWIINWFYTNYTHASILYLLKMDAICARTCLWPSALCCMPISSKDFKGLHLDRRCKHTWTAVTSPGGLEQHQRRRPSDKPQHRGWGRESEWRSKAWTDTKMRHHKRLFMHCTETKSVISCSRVGLSPYNTKGKQRERDEARRRAHHSGTLDIRPGKTTSRQRTHRRGCVSEAILRMSLLCPRSPGWAGLCVCVIDTRRHGGGRLWYFSSCFLYAAAPPQTGHFKSCSSLPPLCVCGSPKGSSGRRCGETQQRVEGHPTSITMDIISAQETQVYCAGHVCVCGKSVALAVLTWMLLFCIYIQNKYQVTSEMTRETASVGITCPLGQRCHSVWQTLYENYVCLSTRDCKHRGCFYLFIVL